MEKTSKTEPTANPVFDAAKKMRKIGDSDQKQAGHRLSKPENGVLGDEVVRSTRRLFVELPHIIDDTTVSASTSAVLHNTDEFQSVEPPALHHLEPGQAGRHLAVDYTPKARGTYETRIQFLATFADGTFEQQTVPVVAKAHELTDPTFSDQELSQLIVRPEEVAAQSPNSPVMTGDKNGGVDSKIELNNLIGDIFDAQVEGVHSVESEQGKYRPPPLPKPLWLDLVGIAVGVGVTMVGGELGMLAATAIEHSLAKAVTKKTAEAIGKRVEKVIETSVDKIAEAAKVGEFGAEATEQHKPETAKGSERQISYDASTDFFAHQVLRIIGARKVARKELLTSLSGLIAEFGENADVVRDSLNAITLSDGKTAQIVAVQAEKTTAQWMRYLARAELPSVTANTPNGKLTTVVMADIREEPFKEERGDEPGKLRGVLQLYAVESERGLIVNAARCNGITGEVAARLPRMDLKAAGIPIVIRYRGTMITIDEAGRIRAGGLAFFVSGSERFHYDRNLPAFTERDEATETTEAHAVNEFVERVLSKSLREQGINVVQTDDSGKG